MACPTLKNVTDRALRYRANRAMPAGERRCALCGNPRGAEVGHVDGHEENTARHNLFWTCRSCNVLAGNAMRRAGAGRLTRQYNPEGATSVGQWLTAVTSMKGESDAMSVHDAVAMIHATPAAKRSDFAREIWSRRRSYASNPAFLPKSLFDRYTVRTLARDGQVSVDNIQTLAGAERKARDFAHKYPCVGVEIVSMKHGMVVKSFKPATTPTAAPKVDRDNTRDYKRELAADQKQAKYVLYVGGQEYATYDTRKEAESFAKDKQVTGGKSTRIKEVMGNPYRVMPRNYAWEVAVQTSGGWQVVATAATKREAELIMDKLRDESREFRGGVRKPIKGFEANPGFVAHRSIGVVSASDGRRLKKALDKEGIPYAMDHAGLTKYEFFVMNAVAAEEAEAIMRDLKIRPAAGNPLAKYRVRYQGRTFEIMAPSRLAAERQVRAIWAGEASVENPGKQQKIEKVKPSSSRRNPDDAGAAEDLYEQFHGVPSTGETIYEEVHEEPDTFTELGDLVEIKVATVHGKDATIAAPDPEGGDLANIVKLASSPDGRQLYFIGGDQALDLEKLGFTESEERHRMHIGLLYQVTYRTKKKFHGLKTTDYYHNLGEETKNQPILLYDPYSEKMSAAGGNYVILPAGITD